MLRVLKYFAESLEPGHLEGFYTRYDSVAEVSAIGEILACAGDSLRSLQIRGSPPCYPSDRKGWEDPLGRDYNELCKTEGEHPPTVSNLPFPWHVMTSAPFQATPLPDLDMDAFRAHL